MSDRGIDCVVTHHLNTFASGVARFNELLAQHLGVPLLGLFDEALNGFHRPLLSFKAGELSSDEAAAMRALVARREWAPQLYLHDWESTPLERELVAAAVRVWSGNLAVRAAVEPLHDDVRDAWTPGLVTDCRVIRPAEITVFSFGMAHKIQTAHFLRLRELLERSGRSYAVLVSSATHATSSPREDRAVHDKMHELFPAGLYFLGTLSDLAVYNHLRQSTYFASFFPGGVRANNTSVAAAMEHGAVVLTNLDEHSPPWMVHMETVIDVQQLDELPDDLLTLRRISAGAIEVARTRSWARLAQEMMTP